MFNKGAMFGLDARVALAIFGALSVISGAALYSAIQEAQITAKLTSVENMAKALQAYYIDTGVDIQSSNIGDLIEDNNVSGWNGPYISGVNDTSSIVHDGIRMWAQHCEKGFGNEFSQTVCTACTTQPCELWIKTSITTMSDNAALDAKIDGSDGYDKGRFRSVWGDATQTDNMRAHYFVKTVN